MKKLLMVLALASVSVAGMAQSETPEMKYSVATNSFWSNWFIQANAVGTSFFNNGEKWSNPIKDYRTNLGASVAIGKWFTPGLGLRTKVTGIWGRSVISTDKETNASKYWQVNEEVLFNLSNIFCGYSDTRVWNFIPYIGGGVGRNMSYNSYGMGLNVGILNTWRLGKHVALNLDLSMGGHETDFDGTSMGGGQSRWKLENKDRTLNAEVGLTFNLGKSTFNKVPDVDAIKALSESQIAALNAQLADANAENTRLNNLIKSHKCPETGAKTVTVKEVAAAPVSVFFNMGSANIASKKDIVNVQALAEVAKANGKTLVVTGYADSKTGSAGLNQKLSEKRANAVKKELVKLGVDESKIEVKAVGGVNDIAPIAYNRRAVVEVK
ncbi:MAG: OmpA family protein [Prevotella sp.]|nr:OmpA family protein [Prevotella sp.]